MSLKIIANQKRGGARRRAKRSAPRRNAGQGGGPIPLVRNMRSEHTYLTSQHTYSSVTDISTANLGAAIYVTANSLNGSNALLSVFDQYCIRNVTVTWIPLCVTSFIAAGTVATVAPTNVYNHNVLSTCIDTDDAAAPANESGILDHESAMVHGPFIRSFSRSFKPAVALEVYQTGGFGGYGNRTDQWIDSASPAVQHYGCKYWLAHGTTAPTGTVTFALYLQATVSYRKRF